MKVLYFTKYSYNGASSRLRSMQYFPKLREEGIEIDVSPLFSDQYLKALYSYNKSYSSVIFGYLKRFLRLFTVFKYDKIVIEYELFPYLPAWTEWLLNLLSVKYIVDYDDAVFHNYDLSPNKWIRLLLSKKIDTVMRNSWTVVAGNSYLAQRAKISGAKSVEIIPTVVDLDRYSCVPSRTELKPFVIGWLGSPSTFKYVRQIKDILSKFLSNHEAVVHVVGATPEKEIAGNIHFIPWSESTEVSEIQKFDVGIMPLDDTPWSRGKCGFKLIQYMACGVPVIASYVGANVDIVAVNKCGTLVESEEEWLEALVRYYSSADLRRIDGLLGRQAVEGKYCLQKTAQSWYKLICG